jgi:hypothetical protein
MNFLLSSSLSILPDHPFRYLHQFQSSTAYKHNVLMDLSLAIIYSHPLQSNKCAKDAFLEPFDRQILRFYFSVYF